MSREIKEISNNEFENEFKKLKGKSVCVDILGDVTFLKLIDSFDIRQCGDKITLCDCEDESNISIKKSAIDCIVQDKRISNLKDTHIFLKNGLEINLQGDVENE